jgi:hypothetical protein
MARSLDVSLEGYKSLLTQAAELNGLSRTFGAGAQKTNVAESFDMIGLTSEAIDKIAFGSALRDVATDLQRQHHQMMIAGEYGVAESVGTDANLRIGLLAKQAARAERLDAAWQRIDETFHDYDVRLLILPIYDVDAFVGDDGQHEFVWPVSGPEDLPKGASMEPRAFALAVRQLHPALGFRPSGEPDHGGSTPATR